MLVFKREDGDRHHQSTLLELNTQCNCQSGFINLVAPKPRESMLPRTQALFWTPFTLRVVIAWARAGDNAESVLPNFPFCSFRPRKSHAQRTRNPSFSSLALYKKKQQKRYPFCALRFVNGNLIKESNFIALHTL